MANAVELAVNIVTKYSDAGMGQAESKFGKFQSGVSKAAKVSAVALGVLGAAAISSAKAAAEDEQSQALLAKAMSNTGATKAQIAATEDFIASLSRATGVTDDEMRPAMAALQRATGDTEESQKALALALDISAATGKPLASVSAALAKGYAGSTTALGKLVPGMNKAVLASGDMNKIQKELARTTGGAAAAAADTAAGKFKIFQTQMGEFQESMGAVLLPIMSKLADILGKVAVWAQKNATAFQIIVGVVAALAAAIIILNAVLKITAIVQAALNLVMLANPVVLVVVAVVALVAALILAYKKSETFRNIVDGTFKAVANAAEAAWRTIKAVWDKVLNAGKTVFNWIKSNWAYLLAGLLFGPFGVAVVAIVKHWDRIKSTAANLLDWLKDAFRAAMGIVRDIVGNQVENVRTILARIRDTANTVTDYIRTSFANAWQAVASAATRALAPVRSAVDGIRSAINWAIDAVNSLISALGRIKVPSIKIPGIGSLMSAPVPQGVSPMSARAYAPGVPRRAVAAPAASGGSVVNVTVTGAVDPEATARQIKRILDGHNRRVGLAT